MTIPALNQKSEIQNQKCCSTGTVLLLIIALAIALRITLALLHPFLFPDSADYDALARTIVEHQHYQVHGLQASRMPGYPAFIAAIYFLCGYSIKAVLVTQALLAGATVYLTYLIAQHAVKISSPNSSTRQLVNSSIPLTAALLAALDPLSIAFSASLLTETPFTFLLLLAILICLRLIDRPHLLSWLALAILWPLAVQLRPAVIWLIIPLALLLILLAKNWRDRLLHLSGLIIVLLLTQASLLPWQQRNEKLFANPPFLTLHENDTRFRFTTLEGLSLYEAVYPEATGGPKQDDLNLHPPAEMSLLNEAQRNDEWSRRAWQYIKADPARIAQLGIKKIARTWSPFLNAADYQNHALQFALALWHIPLYILALVGLLSPLLPTKIKLMLLVPILYFTAVHALFLGSVRYRVPLAPLLALLAAAGLITLLQRIRKPQPQADQKV